MSSIIKSIESASPMYKKAAPGDKLLSINGNEIVDVLDYKYYAYDRRLIVELESPRGVKRRVKVSKREGEELGLEFDTYLMDDARACANRCVFCFVDQLPRGMRRTMYFKDDDARLSFLTGNYITLTNISDRELERIISLKISPINISVHATQPELRARLLGNPDAARGHEVIKRLAAGGISMNCQIVCCPGWNDGDALLGTMRDLAALYPRVNSVSVVPVGLTKHRERLTKLEPFSGGGAAAVVEDVEAFSQKCLERYASRIFFCSDELYLKAGRQLPDDEFYEEYPQLENGVGMLRLLETEFSLAMRSEPALETIRSFSIATGVSAAPFLEKLLVTAREKYVSMIGNVYPIVNDFFGHTIDVAGLVTGGDLINQLRGRPLGERLLIPQSMLRHGEGVFLDDVTLEQAERELKVEVRPVASDGGELLCAMLDK